MKKTTLLHAEISRLIAQLAHMDKTVIGDTGLPNSKHAIRMDLALKAGVVL